MNKLLEKDEDPQSTRKVIEPRKMPLPRKCAQSKPSQSKGSPCNKVQTVRCAQLVQKPRKCAHTVK